MDNKNNNSERGDLPGHNTAAKNSAVFVLAVKLVAVGVVLYVSLNHIDKIGLALVSIYDLFMPLLMGGLLALILNTPMCALERLFTWFGEKFLHIKKRRPAEIAALVMTFVIALLLIFIIMNTIIPQFVESIRTVFTKIKGKMPEYLAYLEEYGVDTEPIMDWILKIDINSLVAQFASGAVNLIGTVVSGASSIISGTFTGVTIIVFAVYILANKRKLSVQMRKLLYAYIKKPFVDRAVKVGRMSVRTFSDFISGQCLDAVILGLLMFITMSIFRFPYATATCSLITVSAVIPYIGAFLGGAFGVLLMVVDDPLRAVLFVVLFIVVQQVDNHLIYPRVVGGSVGLPAIWTFAAVIIGGGVCGILGMVLFIPLFSVFYTLLRDNVYERLQKRGICVSEEEDGDREAY